MGGGLLRPGSMTGCGTRHCVVGMAHEIVTPCEPPMKVASELFARVLSLDGPRLASLGGCPVRQLMLGWP
jgi:hypothetical protein